MELKFDSKEDLEKSIREYENKNDTAENLNVNCNFYMDQNTFEKLSSSVIGQNMVCLSCMPQYQNCSFKIDFSKVILPQLKNFDLRCQGFKAIHFTKENTPMIESISVDQPNGKRLEYFLLDNLPHLKSLNLEFVTIVNSTKFGKSVSSCPNLESIHCYKLWGLGVTGIRPITLVLPKCETLDFYRSDDLDRLKIWAPKLSSLNFQACYSISSVEILDRKPKGYTGPDYKFRGKPADYEVNFYNTSQPGGNITTHKRCKSIFPETDENHSDIDPMEWFMRK